MAKTSTFSTRVVMTVHKVELSGRSQPQQAWRVIFEASQESRLELLTDRATAHRLMKPDTLLVVDAKSEPW